MSPFAPERHRKILKRLHRDTVVRSGDLVSEHGVTPMTIWRDLRLLESQGLLKRQRGGALRVETDEEPRYMEKSVRAREAKCLLAAYVAGTLIQQGDILTLDGGTTIAALAGENLPSGLTILTNSLPVAEVLTHHPASPSLYVSGGFLRAESGTLVGREALAFFSRRRARRFIMSASGLEVGFGVSDPNPREIEVKQAMATYAEEIILVADASKWGKISLMQTLPWRRIDTIVTEKNAVIPEWPGTLPGGERPKIIRV
jgi:DeoR/GlpR family transcriptional regulator of sugar metabolism